MPPKKAAAAKAAPGDAAAASAAASAAPELTPQEEAERLILIEQCKELKRTVVVEEAQVAQFHEEKERLNYLWIVTKKELEDARASVRIREREKEDADEAHDEELKLYRQRIRHLMFEHEVEQTEEVVEQQVLISGINRKRTL